MVKPRTLENYAIYYAALEQIHHTFKHVWDENGNTWEVRGALKKNQIDKTLTEPPLTPPQVQSTYLFVKVLTF